MMVQKSVFDEVLDSCGFARSPAPFIDFLGMQFSSDCSRKHSDYLTVSLSRLGSDLGFVLSTIDDSAIIVSCNEANSYCYVSGYGVIGNKDVRNAEFDLNSVGCGDGQYSVIKYSNGSLISGTDSYGLCVLYKYEGVGFSLVTNRYHLGAMFLHTVGCIVPNVSYINSCALEHMYFQAQPFVNETAIAGFDRVSVGEAVLIRDGKLSCVACSKLSFELDADIELYKKGIEESVCAAVCRVEKVIESFGHSRSVVVDLSAGYDSRSALSMMLRSGCKNVLSLNTIDVTGSADLEVSLAISRMLGLNYSNSIVDAVGVSFRHSLWAWRSYFMGEYNVMALPASSTYGENGFLRCSGGCGEVLREYWNKVFRVKGDENVVSWIYRLLNDKESSVISGNRAGSQIVDYVLSSVMDLSSVDVYNALDILYLKFRNRFHFGMRLFATQFDAARIFPLASVKLFEMSRLLPFLERKDGRVFRDIVRYCYPKLGCVPYNVGLSDEILGCIGLTREGIQESRVLWKRSKLECRVARPSDSLFGDVDKRYGYLRQLADESCDELCEIVPECSWVFIKLRNRFSQAWQNGRERRARFFVSKLLGLLDSFEPFHSEFPQKRE